MAQVALSLSLAQPTNLKPETIHGIASFASPPEMKFLRAAACLALALSFASVALAATGIDISGNVTVADVRDYFFFIAVSVIFLCCCVVCRLRP